MCHRPQHGLQLKYRPWAPIQSLSHDHQHGFWWQHKPQISALLSMVTQATLPQLLQDPRPQRGLQHHSPWTSIHMALCGYMGHHGQQHGPQLQQNHGPKHGPGSSTVHRHLHGLCGNLGHRYCSRTMDSDMVPSHSPPLSPPTLTLPPTLEQQGPQTSTWPQVEVQAMHINMTSRCSSGLEWRWFSLSLLHTHCSIPPSFLPHKKFIHYSGIGNSISSLYILPT